jgi:hypothetical protein
MSDKFKHAWPAIEMQAGVPKPEIFEIHLVKKRSDISLHGRTMQFCKATISEKELNDRLDAQSVMGSSQVFSRSCSKIVSIILVVRRISR